MSERVEFNAALKNAIDEKTTWFNSEELPKLLEGYRLLHTCIKNLYDLLAKRALITPDPYKLEKKITDIEIPDETPFSEKDIAVIIGARFSDYESVMDFVCTYYKFSVENFSLAKIKKFHELNNTFQWTNMSVNNTRVNTKALASLIPELKRNMPQISLSVISESLSKSSKAVKDITKILEELAQFKREEYKFKIRNQIMSANEFDWSKVTDGTSEITEIKRLFPSIMKKVPFYSELVNEIADEDFSETKDEFQKRTLAILSVTQVQAKPEKESVNTKQILMEVLHILSALYPEYSSIAEKLRENNHTLEGSKNTAFKKLIRVIRKAFNLKEPPSIFKLVIVDQQKQTKTSKEIDINIFISNLERKAYFMATIGDSGTPEYKRIQASDETQILQFCSKQISENKETQILLESIDEYFKTNCGVQDRSKIKGLKIDLVSCKNILVKANQRRAEYLAYIDERDQMKKLGISDE